VTSPDPIPTGCRLQRRSARCSHVRRHPPGRRRPVTNSLGCSDVGLGPWYTSLRQRGVDGGVNAGTSRRWRWHQAIAGAFNSHRRRAASPHATGPARGSTRRPPPAPTCRPGRARRCHRSVCEPHMARRISRHRLPHQRGGDLAARPGSDRDRVHEAGAPTRSAPSGLTVQVQGADAIGAGRAVAATTEVREMTGGSEKQQPPCRVTGCGYGRRTTGRSCPRPSDALRM